MDKRVRIRDQRRETLMIVDCWTMAVAMANGDGMISEQKLTFFHWAIDRN